MSNIQIPNLPAAIALNGTEQLEGVQAGTSVKLTVAQLGAYITAQYPPPGVSSIVTSAPITGGTITTSGTIGLAGAGVTNYYLASMNAGTVKANVTGGSAQPTDATPSAVLDLVGSARGSILYRGASGWATLPPGAPASVLLTGGTGTDPVWGSAGSVGISMTVGATPIANGTTTRVLYDNAGTLGEYAQIPVAVGGTAGATAQAAAQNLSTVYTVANITALRALTSVPPTVFMQGYATANDGGEGLWEWVAGSAVADNTGTVVQCASATAGRYFRVVEDTIRPEWFGAKGDGVTIDTSAFNSAIAACNNQSLLLNPAKVGYPIAVTIGSTSGCTGMTSDGGRARLVRPSTATISTNIIYCQRGDFEIENLFFDLPISTDPAVSPLVSYAFRVDLSGSAGRVVFNNNRVKGGRGCVATYGTGAVETYVTNNVLEQFWDEALTIWVNKNVHITGNTIQDGGYSFPGGSGAIRTSAASGVTAENIVIANNIIKNCLVPGGQSAIDCYTPSGARNISITGNICDLNGGGIELKTDNSVPADNAYKNILVADNTVRLLDIPGFNQIGLALNFATSGTADGKASEILISGNQILMDAPPTSVAAPFYGIGVSCYDNVAIVGNSIINTARGIEIAPINTVSAIMRNMSIAGNTVKVTGAGIYSQNPGTIENLRVTDNNVEAGAAFFFTTATTNKAYIANNFGKSSDTYAALGLTNCVDSLITGNTFECDAAYYGVYVYGSGTSGVIVSSNNITTNATTGLEAVRVNAGNSITLLSNQISVPDSRAAYTGAGTITAANNVRGTKTSTPTTAGSVGDVWINSTPASGSPLSWVCTVAGAAGAATFGTSLLGPALTGTTLGLSGSSTIQNATAIPAGGTAGSGYLFSSTANFGVFFGSGAPTLSAAKGSLYLRSDGSATNNRAYINTDGSTTWTALTTAA